jgi:acetoacetyl-CoA synthetase
VLQPAPARDQLTGALAEFLGWLAERHDLHSNAYGELWKSSTDELEMFWSAVWDYYDVGAVRPPRCSPSG